MRRGMPPSLSTLNTPVSRRAPAARAFGAERDRGVGGAEQSIGGSPEDGRVAVTEAEIDEDSSLAAVQAAFEAHHGLDCAGQDGQLLLEEIAGGRYALAHQDFVGSAADS